MNPGAHEARDRRAAALAVALAWSVLLLLPIGRTSELPLLVAVLVGLPLLWRHARAPALALVLVLIAAYALPALLSALDAVEPRKSWTTALGSLRFGLYAAALVLLLGGHARSQALLADMVAALVGLWTLDALVQVATGWSLGGALDADRVSGIFGADDLKLGPVLAVLSPFALLVARRRFGRWAMALAWLALAAAILLAGARAGWVIYGVVSAVLLWREVPRVLPFVGSLFALGVLAAGVSLLAQRGSDEFAERMARTTAVLGGDRASIDHALAGRLPIFETAWAMGTAHPINGVGVRGFRVAYGDYAAVDDPWLRPEQGGAALHPHQILLELFAETGMIGVLAWLIAVAAAIRAWRRADAAAQERALAPGLALAAMLFPLNTHFAFYSSFWGLLCWWLLALYATALVRDPREAR